MILPVRIHLHGIKMVSFSVPTRDRRFILGIHLDLGKTNGISEKYLMLTCISWFNALRKIVQFLRLGQFLSNYKG